MITISPRALRVIREVSAHPVLGEDSGLQIGPAPVPDAPLKVAAVRVPAEDADVVEVDGGRVYLAPGVAERVDGREVDVRTDRHGRHQFVLGAAS